jgi:sulfate adenylyltransferase
MTDRSPGGFTVFLTGLAAAGKSTTAEALRDALVARTARPVTVLDGDVLRRTRWPQLGFSRADRETNVRGMGAMAADVTKQGGIAICAAIAPHAGVRDAIRASIEAVGGFVLVHVATPMAVCERRDPKGLYARARRGEIASFTGIGDVYEPPTAPDVVIDTTDLPPHTAARRIVDYLEAHTYLSP